MRKKRGSRKPRATVVDLPPPPKLRLRAATLSDARFLFRLRNDPVTRAASFRSDEIRFADHVDWLTARLRDPRRTTRLFVVLLGDDAVGQVRFDHEDRHDEISVALVAGARGKGLGTSLLTRASEAALRRGVPRVLARVKPDNEASIRAFERAGFRRSGALRKKPAPHVVLLYQPKPR